MRVISTDCHTAVCSRIYPLRQRGRTSPAGLSTSEHRHFIRAFPSSHRSRWRGCRRDCRTRSQPRLLGQVLLRRRPLRVSQACVSVARCDFVRSRCDLCPALPPPHVHVYVRTCTRTGARGAAGEPAGARAPLAFQVN